MARKPSPSAGRQILKAPDQLRIIIIAFPDMECLFADPPALSFFNHTFYDAVPFLLRDLLNLSLIHISAAGRTRTSGTSISCFPQAAGRKQSAAMKIAAAVRKPAVLFFISSPQKLPPVQYP